VAANPDQGNAMPHLYETSLSDAAWEVVEPIFPTTSKFGRPRVYSIRSIVDAVLYAVKNGCVWRCLPNDFPPWPIVYHYFRTWSNKGLWEILNSALVVIARHCAGKKDTPSLVSVDSQSQTAEPGVEDRGLDGGKKVNGRKRHIAVDTLGLILICICTAANTADCVAGQKLVELLNNRIHFPRLKKILGDNAYRGFGIDFYIGVTIEASERKEGQKGFVPQAFRWAVERTFAWLSRQRRLVRNYEKKIKHQESMNYIANARLCIRRFEKWFTC
jgi:putative transposase